MTRSTAQVRSGQFRRADALVKGPRVVIAAVLWLLFIEALPAPGAWGVLTVVVAGTLAAVVAEPVVVRLLWWARTPSRPLVVPGAPQVRVLVTGRTAAGIGQAGRRHLIVPTAWVGRADMPELLARARRRQVVSAGRFEVAYQWLTWPWQVLTSFVAGFAHGASGVPLIGFAWRVRWVVASIALWQSVAAERVPAVVGIVVVLGLTYLLPWTTAHRERLVGQALTRDDRTPAAPASPVPQRPPRRAVEPTPTLGGRRPCIGAQPRNKQPCGRWRTTALLATCTYDRSRGHTRAPRTPRTKGTRS